MYSSKSCVLGSRTTLEIRASSSLCGLWLDWYWRQLHYSCVHFVLQSINKVVIEYACKKSHKRKAERMDPFTPKSRWGPFSKGGVICILCRLARFSPNSRSQNQVKCSIYSQEKSLLLYIITFSSIFLCIGQHFADFGQLKQWTKSLFHELPSYAKCNISWFSQF